MLNTKEDDKPLTADRNADGTKILGEDFSHEFGQNVMLSSITVPWKGSGLTNSLCPVDNGDSTREIRP